MFKTTPIAAICGVVAILAALIAPGVAGAEPEVPETLRVEIKDFIQATPGHIFAGFCEEIEQNEHDGEWCATVIALGEGQAEVRYGPISSSPALTPLYYATFVTAPSGWLVTANTGTFAAGFEVPAGLRAIIRSTVESSGNVYAGLCGETNMASHLGQHCVLTLLASTTKTTATIQSPTGIYQESFVQREGVWIRYVEEPPVVTEALRSAIKSHIEANGYQYGGLCNEIRVTPTATIWCASLKSLTEAKAVVHVGRAPSAERFSVTLVKNGNRWSVTGSNVPQLVLASLLDAIENEVEEAGYRYAGLCEGINPSKHAGSWCASIDKLTLDDARVLVGPVRSQDDYTIRLERRGSSWVVVSSNVPAAVPDALRAAVQATVVGRGYQFGGLCAELGSIPEGKWCVSIQMLDSNSASVTFKSKGQPQHSATYVKVSGGWSVQAINLPLNVPTELRLAIAQGVGAAGYSYAGLCQEIDPRASVGKACATILSQSSVEAVLRYGRVLSNEAKMMTLVRKSSGWVVLTNSGVMPPTPTPTAAPPTNTPAQPAPVVNTPVPSTPIVDRPSPQQPVQTPVATPTEEAPAAPSPQVPTPAVPNQGGEPEMPDLEDTNDGDGIDYGLFLLVGAGVLVVGSIGTRYLLRKGW